MLREEEHGRHSYFHKYLGQDPKNSEFYDLVLNTARLSPAEQTAAVLALYHARFPH
jgi:cytidylate kinase